MLSQRWDSAHAITSAGAAVFSFLLNDLPLAVVGVKLSVIVMAFAGVMLSFSVFPWDFPDRKTWPLAFLFTLVSSAAVNLALRREGLDETYSLGMGAILGFGFPTFALLTSRNWKRLQEAVVERVRGRK